MEDNSEFTFFTAIRKGNIDAVRSLLDESPSLIDARYVNDMPPLSLAIGCGYLDIAEELLRYGADPNDKFYEYYLENYIDLLELLLQYNLNPNTIIRKPACTTILVNLYAHDYSIDKLELLISYGADIEARDHFNMTTLHWAFFDSELQTAKYLINIGADIEAVDHSGKTPLFYASARGSIELVDILLHKGADPYRKDIDGNTVISYACMTDFKLKTSIENGVPTTRFIDTKPDMVMLNRLIEHTGEEILTIFDSAIMNNIDIVDKLIKKDTSLIDAKNNLGMSPLQCAVKMGNVEMTQYLLNKGASLDYEGDSDPPIHLSVSSGSIRVTEILLDFGVSANSRDDLDRTPLHEAVVEDLIDIIQLLLARGADPNAVDSDNEVPIHSARSPECIKILLEAGANPNARDYSGNTALYLWNIPYLETVRILHSFGADIQTRNDDGETPINYAITTKNSELLDALVCVYGIDSLSVFDVASVGVLPKLKEWITNDPSVLHATNGYRKNKSLLHYAAEADKLEIAKYLVESGIEVDMPDDDGETPLFAAIESGGAEVLAYLLSKGANLNVKDTKCGSTPLHEASYKNNLEAARILIEHGADINARINRGDTSLDYVENKEMEQLLMRAGGIT